MLCFLARELAVGAMRVDVVRFRTCSELFASDKSEGEGLLMPKEPAPEWTFVRCLRPREFTFDDPATALLGLAPSDDEVGGFGMLDLRSFTGTVPPVVVVRPVCEGPLNDGIGDLARADRRLVPVSGAFRDEDVVVAGFMLSLGIRLLVIEPLSLLTANFAGAGGAAGLGRTAAGLAGGAPAPMFHTLRTKDLAAPRKPNRDLGSETSSQ